MHRMLARFAALLSTLVALQAGAAFHLFVINEAYSNSSGTLQYVEMTALAGGQQFTQGHSLVAAKSIVLNSNLPGDTSGRRVLFGTAGVAAAFGVTPDYIIPDNFLAIGGGTINWGESSDIWNYGPLPTDGLNSLQRSGPSGGVSGTGTPQNFAGVIGTTVASGPAQTFQGLWWASPAGSENGWGVNVAHQGNTLFATWFTYEDNNEGMWLVMDNAVRQANGSFTGPIYRTTGNSFSSVPFNPSTIGVTQVGTGTFTFTSATAGTFTYTVNSITQTKNIVRQEFAAPIPTCTAGGTAGATPNYQDLWWRSPAGSESGWGINLIHQGNTIFATWFTYGSNSKGMWLVMDNLQRTPGTQTFTGPIYRTRGNAFNSVPWNAASISVTQVGTATISFTDANNGTFNYTVDGTTQSKPITRQVFANPVSVCRTD